MYTQVLQSYKRDLTLRGYSPRTQETYYRSIRNFFDYCKESPEVVTKETIKNYLYHLVRERNLSDSSLRQARSAICYFFSQTMGRYVEVENIPVQKKKKKLPEVFTVEEVFKIIRSTNNLKHKTILMLTYSSGLRVGELVNLKVRDILRDSMRLKVRDAKGGKDRYTLLSEIFTAVQRLRVNAQSTGQFDKIQKEIDVLTYNFEEDIHGTYEAIALPIFKKIYNKDLSFIDEDEYYNFNTYLCEQYFRTNARKEAHKRIQNNFPQIDAARIWNISAHMLATMLAFGIVREKQNLRYTLLENTTELEFKRRKNPLYLKWLLKKSCKF